MKASDWIIDEPCLGVQLVAGEQDVSLRSDRFDLTSTSVLAGLVPLTRLGRLLPSLVAQLQGMDLLAADAGNWRIEYSDFAGIEELELQRVASASVLPVFRCVLFRESESELATARLLRAPRCRDLPA